MLVLCPESSRRGNWNCDSDHTLVDDHMMTRMILKGDDDHSKSSVNSVIEHYCPKIKYGGESFMFLNPNYKTSGISGV